MLSAPGRDVGNLGHAPSLQDAETFLGTERYPVCLEQRPGLSCPPPTIDMNGPCDPGPTPWERSNPLS